MVWAFCFSLKIEGKTLLLDPMFGDASSPFPLFNSKRYSGAFSLEREDLQEIDAIIISHNHYDHLNYKSIMRLKIVQSTFMFQLELRNI